MNSFSLEIGEIILESIILKEYVLVSCLAYIFKFVFCNPCQSSPSLTILVPLWFFIISLVFFCLSNILFFGLLLSKDNFFLHGQNNWKASGWAPLSMFHFLSYCCCFSSVVSKTCLIILIFFLTADVYISMEKDAEAYACVQEAHLIFPLSPDVLYQVRMKRQRKLFR